VLAVPRARRFDSSACFEAKLRSRIRLIIKEQLVDRDLGHASDFRSGKLADTVFNVATDAVIWLIAILRSFIQGAPGGRPDIGQERTMGF